MTDATNSALNILVQERDRISQAIQILQGDAVTPAPKRRGRPPKSAAAASAPAASAPKAKKKRGRPQMSDEARQAVSERMRKYWAKRRKEKKAASK